MVPIIHIGPPSPYTRELHEIIRYPDSSKKACKHKDGVWFDICLELTWAQAVSHTVMTHSSYTKCVIFLRAGLCKNWLQTKLKIKSDITTNTKNQWHKFIVKLYVFNSINKKQTKESPRDKWYTQTKKHHIIIFPTIISAINVY